MFALKMLFVLYAAVAHADPVTLRVNFFIEICKVEADGTFCDFNPQPTEQITLGNGEEAPSLWVNNQSFSGISFEGSIGLVRYADGDRLIFRSLTSPPGKDGSPAYIALKLRSWRQMEDFFFQPEPLVVGNTIYQPHLNVWPVN